MPTDLPLIPLEEVARYPRPGLIAPSALAFSPDDRWITYLFSPQGELSLQLYRLDTQTGERCELLSPPGGGISEANLSREEKLRRERQRQLATGVTAYAWAKDGRRLLVPLADGIYLLEDPTGEQEGPVLRRLAGPGVEGCGPEPVLDARLSPDGAWVAYVQDDELYVAPTQGGPPGNRPQQVTQGARGMGRTHGLAEYIAQEEMGRRHGYWWSPDSRSLAFTEVDETHIPVYRIVHQGQDATGESAQEDHRYPFAGGENARVRLGVVRREGGEPVWMNLGEGDQYLARAGWFPDGSLWAQIENRAQTALDLARFDPQTGERTTFVPERSDTWINLHDLFRPLERAKHQGGFLWASESTGFRHLYLYDQDGKLARALTAGEWQVDELAGVDEAAGRVYFTATRDGPTEKRLYAVPLAGGEPCLLTPEPGIHNVVIDHACKRFIDVYEALDQPPGVRLRSLADGELVSDIWVGRDPRLEALDLQPPELVQLAAPDGETLYGLLYRPPAHFGPGPHPAIISVYGGPHVQLASDSWRGTAALREQALSRLGFVVFTLDNRGSARRGLRFEGQVQGNLGDLEVQDQVAGVCWLVEQGLADPERVGVTGWSYGGYMALMCLARAPQVFRAAVAGAPVTHWDGYDTHYTERYMGTPGSNPQGYVKSSVMAHVERMMGRLMLVHGLIDENVHFRHTARLINALIRARKPYDLLLFPDERHTPRRQEDRVFMEEQIQAFFLRQL